MVNLLMVRRRALAHISDYLQGVEWVHGQYINANGGIATNNLLKYSDTLIFVTKGDYRLEGRQSVSNIIAYRFHEYSEDGRWIKQLHTASTRDLPVIAFTVPYDCYIKLSIADTFEGVLKKVG